MPIQRPYVTFYVGTSSVCPICLRDNHELPKCTRFESLTVKITIKDVGDSDENWPANVPCQCAYLCENWHLYV